MTDDLGSSWYVVENSKTENARVIAGPIDDVGDARHRASQHTFPAKATLGIWLVYNIQEQDYDVEWADGVDQPSATIEQSDGGHTHA